MDIPFFFPSFMWKFENDWVKRGWCHKKCFYELRVSHVTLTAKYLSRASFSVVAEFYSAQIFQVVFGNGFKLWVLHKEFLWQWFWSFSEHKNDWVCLSKYGISGLPFTGGFSRSCMGPRNLYFLLSCQMWVMQTTPNPTWVIDYRL